jgi:hypothetical protein
MDGDDAAWTWTEERCAVCGLVVRIVATVRAIAERSADWYADPRCTVCKGRTPAALN